MIPDFDILVIGKGLVGSAAAKYLSGSAGKVAVIGADEPGESKSSLVYASHYDQARVQRIVGKDEVWTRLNFDSTEQYESIQKKSGIHFHYGIGCLYVNAYGEDDYLRNFSSLARKFDVTYKPIEHAEENYNDFGGLVFPGKAAGIIESNPSGYINPRLLIKAQLEITKQQGGLIISDTVIKLSVRDNGSFLLETESGKTYSTKQVLVATGSFINYFDILPQKLKLITKGEVVLLVKVDEELLDRYSTLPSLLYEIDEDETEAIYLIPPVKYPDGNYYLKIGCNSPDDVFFDTLEQVQNWFRNSKSESYAPARSRALQRLLPSLNLDDSFTKKCVISWTATGRPYIGETAVKGLFLAGGCNGYSAMCSDAIGRVAAQLILNGNIPEDYPANAFGIEYVDEE
ncbi:FAD-dependent oxidoreductase [Pedobacter sp. HMF7647]|uniref:FAD-dependent oxidoreductase n=1 Tax=Hufsiella arboris TaxID=2695275 RepID=A0A7K1YAB2_9SPHI|nr:FAD-dependent oxidoreductase [Hufsiella arboris]